MSSRRSGLVENLHRAGRAHSDATVLFHGAIAERLGINATDEKAMSLLERDGPMTAGDLARRTGLATASVTALLDRLEARGFVRRRRDPADRRRVIVEADPAGVAQFLPFFAGRRKAFEAIYARFDAAALAAITEFLRQTTQQLKADTARLARGRHRPG